MPENIIQQELQACAVQADWMKNSKYKWQSNPTIPKSKYYGTCVTYVACVLQRISILSSGQYVWHGSRGNVIGANDKMTVFYPSGSLHQIAPQLQAGDIVMDGNARDTASGSHIFILTGQWSGSNPIIWDNHSAQQNLGAYEYRRNRPIIAVIRLGEIPFTPRKTDTGIVGNPYYYSRNPFYLAGYGMPNCTAYAWGRFWEIADYNHDYSNRPTLSTGNAEDWYGYTQDGYERGNVPRLGAIACYADGAFSGDGHVCVIEEIDTANNRCLVSESAYNGYFFRASHYISMNGDYGYGGYVFQGFIYNPFTGGSPWWRKNKVWLLKRELYNREEYLIR